jgi:hypothetical protein
MVIMSCINVVCAMFVASDPPGVNGLSAIDEEEEPPEETWEFERPAHALREDGSVREEV